MTKKNRRIVNLRAILILGASGLALGLGVHFVHGFQVKRNAQDLYERALQLEKEGQMALAAAELKFYLGLVPTDIDAQVKFGFTLRNLATTTRARLQAFLVLEQVLRQDADRADVRREVVRIAMQQRYYTDAKVHLQILLKASPRDAELLQDCARCEVGMRQMGEAAEWYARAIEAAPQQIELYLELALVLRELKRADAADKTIERMIAANESSLPARMGATRYFKKLRAWDRAHQEIRFVFEKLQSQEVDAFLLAAEIVYAKGLAEEARKYLDEGRKLHPLDSRINQETARMELQKGDIQQAHAHLDVSLKSSPQQPEELWKLGTLMLDAGEMDKARDVAAQLEKKAGATPHVCYLRARLLMHQGLWGEARLSLDKAQSKTMDANFSKHVHLSAAKCYERLGNPDQQYQAVRRALDIDSVWRPAHRAMASALTALGKLDQAITEYRLLVNDSPELRREFAEVLIQRTLRQPVADRDWAPVQQLVKLMADGKPPTTDLQLLRAMVLAWQQKLPEARQLAEAERERDPKNIGVWLFLAALAQTQEKTLLPLLEEAERQAGKRADWELLRARYWAGSGAPEAKAELSKIEGRLPQYADAEKNRLVLALARAFAVVGDRAAEERLLRLYLDRDPNNLAVRFILFETTLEPERIAEAQLLLDAIKRLEGTGGALTAYGEAALLVLAGKNDPRGLGEARRRLAEAATIRPSWSRVPLLEAMIHDLENHKEAALAKYLAALDRGETRLTILRRTVHLLYAQGRYAEAHALLRKLPDEALTREDLGPLAAMVAAFNSDGEDNQDAARSRQRVLRIARQAVQAKSNDYHDYLWLGHLAWMDEKKDEAETAFRQARDRADKAPETWTALLLFLANTDPQKAEAELAEAQRRLPQKQLPLVLAPCYEALGRLELAEAQFRAALADQPEDPQVLRNVAGYLMRMRKFPEAEPLLRTIVAGKTQASKDTVDWSRRCLVVALGSRGDYRRLQEGLAILDANKNSEATAEDQLARALVLGSHPAHYREAIRVLESTAPRQSALAPESQFMLAHLYEVAGDWPKARGHMIRLLSAHQNNPVYLGWYAKCLLQHDGAGEAQALLDRLPDASKQTLPIVELRLRVLQARDESAAAASLLKDFAQESKAPLDQIARLLDVLGQSDEAEKTYRNFVAAGKQPESVLLLAQHLAGRNRLPEALDLCERAWQTCSPDRVAATCISVIRAGNLKEEQLQRVEAWFTAALQKHPQSVSLRMILAEMLDRRGRHPEAVALYRELLQKNQRNYVVLNNLAYLLAVQGGHHAEALELINESISLVGPLASVLNTRATVYLKNNQVELARKDLDQALQQKANSTTYYHLAHAHYLAKNNSAAADAFRRATTLGLKVEEIHILELPTFQRLAMLAGK